jgi:hypothetical protein
VTPVGQRSSIASVFTDRGSLSALSMDRGDMVCVRTGQESL